MYLRQATAAQSRSTPPFLDDVDFKTAETSLTIANTDVKLIVNGGASVDKNSGGGTHRANGVYGLTFDATDTATVGEMEVSIKVAGALPVFMKFWVLEEAVYDALFAASALGYVANAPVNVAQLNGSATPVTNLNTVFNTDFATVYDATNKAFLSKLGNFSMGGSSLALTISTLSVGSTATFVGALSATNASNDIRGIQLQTSQPGVTIPTVTTVGTVNALAANTITTASIADGAFTAAKFAAGAFDAVWTVTTRTLTSISGLGIALATKLTKYVQLLARKDTAIATDNATELSEINANVASGAGTFANTSDALEAIRDRGDVAWITATGFSTLDAAGVRSAVGLASANLDTQLSSIQSDTNDLQTQIGAAGAGLSAIPKTGFKLASDGLNLIIPADPNLTKPTFAGNATIVQWIAYFGAWSVNPVSSDSDSVDLKNTANSGNLATHAISDNGTTFSSGAAT